MEKFQVAVQIAGMEYVLEDDITLEDLPKRLSKWEDELRPIARKMGL